MLVYVFNKVHDVLIEGCEETIARGLLTLQFDCPSDGGLVMPFSSDHHLSNLHNQIFVRDYGNRQQLNLQGLEGFKAHIARKWPCTCCGHFPKQRPTKPNFSWSGCDITCVWPSSVPVQRGTPCLCNVDPCDRATLSRHPIMPVQVGPPHPFFYLPYHHNCMQSMDAGTYLC